ncbi:hypothetical protein C2E23DRAFT_104115 [Lenzites betulinus]|nr:hypothetical protein C2E23DRAFT_104115 [Lenzites betulinus]
MTYLVLARNHLGSAGKPSSALNTLVADSTDTAAQLVGSPELWVSLSAEERMAIYVEQLKISTHTELGKALYDGLPEDERRPLDLFLRLGCAMHKDLNSVKGGNSAMMLSWGDLGAVPPILLANKENASALRGVDIETIMAASSLLSTEDLSPAELQALESSTRGGVKLTSLAGALFNHKDDKKGHHDTYSYYFREVVGQPLRFPDTSNTRYGSHCAAAAELLVHREHYLRFLEVVRDRKERTGFNHMEENVFRGLQDVPTLTELAVLALYGQAVTYPYLRTARRFQNGLKLGPFHDQLKSHIEKLIETPDLLLDASASASTAALDGEEWEHPDVVAAILKLVPELPHIREVLLAFLEGTKTTWARFTVEFAKGGAIDSATETELDRAFLLPTNDHNEGALGGYRLWSRKCPNGSEAYFNALTMYHQNGTEEFMDAHLSSLDDQKHIRAAARDLDSSGHERTRRKALVQHNIAVANQRSRERLEKQRKADAAMEKIRLTVLILDLAVVDSLKNTALDEQLEVYRKRQAEQDPLVPMKSKVTRRAEKLEALKAAIARLQSRAEATAAPGPVSGN